MDLMKAAVFHGPGRVRVESVDRPQAGRGGLLIRVDVAMVCATDVKTWQAGHPLIVPPIVLGHEFAGTVLEMHGVPGFAPGDRATAAPYIECGQCYFCRHGVPELCETKDYPSNGAFAEYVWVSRRFARRGVAQLAPDLPREAGAFIEPLACVLNGLEEVRFRRGEFAAIVGGGPMGLLHVLALRDQAAGLLVSEPEPERRDAANRLGAQACDPAQAHSALLERTEGRGADVVVVAVGSPAVAAASLPLARRGGRVLWFGGFPRDVPAAIDPNIVHYRQVAVHGTTGFASRHFRRAAAMIMQGLDPTPLITHRLPLSHVVEALELAASRKALKVALVIAESGDAG